LDSTFFSIRYFYENRPPQWLLALDGGVHEIKVDRNKRLWYSIMDDTTQTITGYSPHPEGNIFASKTEAQAECDRRNKKEAQTQQAMVLQEQVERPMKPRGEFVKEDQNPNKQKSKEQDDEPEDNLSALANGVWQRRRLVATRLYTGNRRQETVACATSKYKGSRLYEVGLNFYAGFKGLGGIVYSVITKMCPKFVMKMVHKSRWKEK
jgi:hypothetical protein